LKKKPSLRFQLISILLLFIVLVLGFIIVFQTVTITSFYKKNAVTNIKDSSEEISSVILNSSSSDELERGLYDVALKNDVCVKILSSSGTYDVNNEHRACALRNLSSDQNEYIVKEVLTNDGTRLFENFKLAIGPNDINDLYIYGKLVNYNDSNLIVLVSSIVAPMDPTLDTLREQTIYIALIVIAVTIILALILAKYIIKPIKAIKNEAHNLATGNYNGDLVKTNSEETSELNKMLTLANEDINSANTAKKELIANVSHDLRTPLTMIVGYAEMMKDIKDENNEENLDVIINESKRLSTLVNDLLDYSKSDNNSIVIKKENVKLNDVLDEVYLQYDKYFENQKIKFNLIKSDDITVCFDVLRIKQVLYNFLNNAYNYNRKKDKEITLGVEKIDSLYRVYVKDNGDGIEEKDINNIWDRYYKVDKEHQRGSMGSGIGLSLSKQLLIKQEIKYGVESKIGEYSKFYFDIEEVK